MGTWFITGASRGFGAEIARRALERGERVVATARRPEAVTERLGRSARLLTLPLDVTDEAQARTAVKDAVAWSGGIDALVNNAGRGQFGALEEVSDAETRSLFDLNVFGLMHVIRAALPTLRAQGHGRIVNMGSMAGLVATPGIGLYNATKFAVDGLSESLAQELAPFGIGVMVVEPGQFQTGFMDPSSISIAAEPLTEYDATPAGMARAWARQGGSPLPGDPVKAAALIYDAVTAPVMPGRLLIGADCVAALEVKLSALAEEFMPWRDRAVATGFDD
jgi:NAD(P)-dependent dehydrogenase (short-subunit alcohol dehydrogenase family)